jgi:hypothetical protein
MHKPVVVPPAGHPVPSGAPAEHTTDTSISFSPHATTLSPVTMRYLSIAAAHHNSPRMRMEKKR